MLSLIEGFLSDKPNIFSFSLHLKSLLSPSIIQSSFFFFFSVQTHSKSLWNNQISYFLYSSSFFFYFLFLICYSSYFSSLDSLHTDWKIQWKNMQSTFLISVTNDRSGPNFIPLVMTHTNQSAWMRIMHWWLIKMDWIWLDNVN